MTEPTQINDLVILELLNRDYNNADRASCAGRLDELVGKDSIVQPLGVMPNREAYFAHALGTGD